MERLKFCARYYRVYGDKSLWGHFEEDVEIDMNRVAFLLVDIYGLGFSPEDGVAHPRPALVSWTVEQEKAVTVGKIKPALDAARRAGMPIVYVSNSAPKIDLAHSEFNKQMKRAYNFDFAVDCTEDSVDPREFHYGPSAFLKHSKIIAPRPEDYYIRKLYYSGFCDTRLDKLLRHLDVKTLVFVGYALDVCLHCTMIDAMNANYEVFFLRDCTLTDAEDIPGNTPGSMTYTERMIHWHEMNVGRSTTMEEFVKACQAVKPRSQ